MPWKYERDESPRRKHQGTRRHVEFVERDGVLVGKCPSTITMDRATEALNSGFEFYGSRDGADHPGRIYAVIDGVVYRATPTNPGVSYHAFPELPEKFKPYSELRDAIMELAEIDGSAEEVKKWLRKCRKA